MDIQILTLTRYLFLMCVTYFIPFTRVVTCSPSYHLDTTFTDLQCPTLTYDLGTSRSKLDCSIRCDDTLGCRSFFYNSISRSCYGTGSGPVSTSGCSKQVGNVYYKTTDTTTTSTTTTTVTTTQAQLYGAACSSNSQCTLVANTACLGGTCQCSAGYRLVSATQSCVTSCSTYGSTYIAFPDMLLNTAAIGSQNGYTVTQCMTYCSGMTSSTGFTYCGICGNMCRCKMGTPLDNPADWGTYSGVDYYSRNCA